MPAMFTSFIYIILLSIVFSPKYFHGLLTKPAATCGCRNNPKSSIAFSLYLELCFKTVIKALALEPFFLWRCSALITIALNFYCNRFWNLGKVISQGLMNSRFGQLLHFWP